MDADRGLAGEGGGSRGVGVEYWARLQFTGVWLREWFHGYYYPKVVLCLDSTRVFMCMYNGNASLRLSIFKVVCGLNM